MGKFGNIQAYDFQKAISRRMEDKYNYYCEFPKSYEQVVIKVYSSWVAKYEKDQSKLLCETSFSFDYLEGIDVYDPKVINKICREMLKGSSLS